MARRPGSIRIALRDFQSARGAGDAPCDDAFLADLQYLQNRDLDLSIRLGAMLAFNALLITIGTHPVSASPGAPLSVDAAQAPLLTLASLAGLIPFAASSVFVLRALLIGEETAGEGLEGNALRQRLFAAYVRSIDAQAALLSRAVRWTIAGGALTIIIWAFILGQKMLG